MGAPKASNRDQNDGVLARCRQLWNAFDPIGVYVDWRDDWPRDEYDRYATQTVRLLASGSGLRAVQDYVRESVEVSMGLNGFPEDEIAEFTNRLWQLSSKAIRSDPRRPRDAMER